MKNALLPNAPRRLSRMLALLLALSLAAPAVPQGLPQGTPDSRNALPSLGDTVSGDVSVGTERRLGERVMRELRRDPDFLDDPVLLDQLEPMWASLIEASKARGNIPIELQERFAWELFLVRDRSVNAFALPGGYVGAHLGLIAITATPDELASVLAHELSHVTQRHIARSIGGGQLTSFAGIAGLLLGILVASRSPDAANALITGGQAVAMQGQLNFSRDMEREADRVGFNVLTAAGYAPGGMAAMFEKLLQGSRLSDNQSFPYLRSHPLTTDRIGEARSRLGVEGAAALPRTLTWALIQARARVMMDPRDAALQRVQDMDRPAVLEAAAGPGERLGSLYASALASILRGDAPRAQAAIAAAGPLAAAEPAAARMVELLALQGLIARRDVKGSTAQLDRLLADPAAQDSRALLLAQAQVALMPGASGPSSIRAAERAAERLQVWVALNGHDAAAWASLSQLWARLDQPLRSVRAEAESHAAQGDVIGAVDRLRAGQRLVRSVSRAEEVEAAIIDARLRDLEARRRELVLEERRGG